MRAAGRLLLGLVAVASGCGNFVPLDERIGVRAGEEQARQEAVPKLVHRREHDSLGRLVREWSEWYVPGERRRKEGLERHWDSAGTLRVEWSWKNGVPRGRWRTWHAGGSLRSDFECAGPDVEGEMRFLHENGQLSARGPGIDGVRQGTWRHWYPNGQLRKEGDYQRGMENGTWTLWHEDGSLEARGTYANGKRIGPWERPGREVVRPLVDGPEDDRSSNGPQ